MHNQTYFNKRGDDDSIPTKGNFLIPSTISISPATSLPFRMCAVFSGCLKERRMKIWIGHFPNNPRSHCLAICPSNPSLTRTYSFYPFSIPLLTFRRNIFFSFSNSLSICFVSTYCTRIFCLYFQWKTNIRICLQVCAKVGNSGGENV